MDSCLGLLVILAGSLAVAGLESNGNFYVGLLGYMNSESQDWEGRCCDGNKDVNGSCSDVCDLIFNVTVTGLDGSSKTLRPSEIPISDHQAKEFLSAYGVVNPLKFEFSRWPGSVNISVTVYDEDDPGANLQLVDRFSFLFVHDGPTLSYVKHTLAGQRSTQASSLTTVFRYECPHYHGNPCFTDCLEHSADEKCPVTSPKPVVTDITFTGLLFNCGDPNQRVSDNCTTTAMVTTESTPTTDDDLSTTPRKYLDGNTPTPAGTSPSETTNDVTTVDIETSTSSHVTSGSATTSKALETDTTTESTKKSQPTTIDTETTSVRPSDKTTSRSISSDNSGEGESTTPADLPTSTEEEHYTYVHETMAYWPGIVGGVLGGIALVAAVLIFLYYRRQKKLQKRQDIYNVNPKILRNFDVYEENGTSGRADVPLETESV